jgi:hypothetical protein
LDEWVLMPNHFHGIIVIHDVCDVVSGWDGLCCRGGSRGGGSRTAPTTPVAMADAIPVKQKPLGRLVGAFKTVSTKHINQIRGTPGLPVWQRNYYEHVIRNDASLNRIRRYILENPSRWGEDHENPAGRPGGSLIRIRGRSHDSAGGGLMNSGLGAVQGL